jgi:hypothetical protein
MSRGIGKPLSPEFKVLGARSAVDWITAVKFCAIRRLVDAGAVQLDVFNERNLYEFRHEDFPGERSLFCRNPQVAQLRVHKRRELLATTTKELKTVVQKVTNRVSSLQGWRGEASQDEDVRCGPSCARLDGGVLRGSDCQPKLGTS